MMMAQVLAIGRGMLVIVVLAMACPTVWSQASDPSDHSAQSTGLGSASAFQADWELLAPMPEPRALHTLATDDAGRIYSFGGLTTPSATQGSPTVDRFDPATGDWNRLASMPRAILSGSAARIGHRIFLPGDAASAETLVLNLTSGVWSTWPANQGFSARSEYMALAWQDRLVVLGGVVSATGQDTDEVWILDPELGQWALLEPMRSARISFSAGVVGDEIVLSGGVGFPGFDPVNTTEIFDGQVWRTGQSLPIEDGLLTRWSYNASVSDGVRLWLAGGRRDGGWNVLDHVGSYDPLSDQWQTTPDLPSLSQPRAYPAGIVTPDGYFHVLGGRNATATELYATHERLRIRPPQQFEVGGPVLGLLGQGLQLQETQSGEVISVSADSTRYRFLVDEGSSYALSVLTRPSGPGQRCEVDNPTGQVDAASILNLTLRCETDQFTVGGSITGLTGSGLTLIEARQNLTQALPSTALSHAFLLDDGRPYKIAVGQQPSGQICQVANAIGQVQGGEVGDVDVSCFPIDIELEPATLNLGAIALGEQVSGYLRVRNPGSIELDLLALEGELLPFNLEGGSCLPLPHRLAAGSTCDFRFGLIGLEQGPVEQRLNLNSTAISAPSAIQLRGFVLGERLSIPVDDSRALLLLTLSLLLLGLWRLAGSNRL